MACRVCNGSGQIVEATGYEPSPPSTWSRLPCPSCTDGHPTPDPDYQRLLRMAQATRDLTVIVASAIEFGLDARSRVEALAAVEQLAAELGCRVILKSEIVQ